MKEEEKSSLVLEIPPNYNNHGGAFRGAIPYRNIIEATIVCLPLLLILQTFLPKSMDQVMKIFIMIIVTAPFGLVCIVGADGGSFGQFIANFFKFKKTSKKMRYRRINDPKRKGDK